MKYSPIKHTFWWLDILIILHLLSLIIKRKENKSWIIRIASILDTQRSWQTAFYTGNSETCFFLLFNKKIFFKSRTYKHYGTGKFIDNLYAINDTKEFFKSSKNLYPRKPELRVENQKAHVTFPNLYVTIKDNILIYKLFEKRDKFSFFIVGMPHLSSNIPSSTFYGSFHSELLRMAVCTLVYSNFFTKNI